MEREKPHGTRREGREAGSDQIEGLGILHQGWLAFGKSKNAGNKETTHGRKPSFQMEIGQDIPKLPWYVSI